ncbi:serine hydrolase [Pseudoclavibacter sp. 13-3]|uniref:serine hydrolase n=1 Tax=Pseudoclavibacter sp. 13-3 TaxID=2901228 RepID=UPI001E52A4BE|nr:serine hydrolase [Pseudoclavibacter sp. 13-3]MCD7101105.1 class A beta-lactamase-related serine hydrolase [Pseudoclavibacter sp. 13-3]
MNLKRRLHVPSHALMRGTAAMLTLCLAAAGVIQIAAGDAPAAQAVEVDALSAAAAVDALQLQSPQLQIELQSRLQGIVDSAAQHGVKMGIALGDLSGVLGGESVAVGAADEEFKAASTIKIGLAAVIMRAVDDGRWDLQTPVTVRPSDIVGGTGTLQGGAAATSVRQLPLGELLRLMITVSDNTATNVLIDFVGGLDAVGVGLRALGIADADMHFGRKMVLSHDARHENLITATGDMRLLERIHAGEMLSRAASDQIIDWMRQQTVNTKFGAVVPRTELANKTGENVDVSHDTGYLLTPGREVALAVMTSFGPGVAGGAGTASAADRDVQDVARAVHDVLVAAPRPAAGSEAGASESASHVGSASGLADQVPQGTAGDARLPAETVMGMPRSLAVGLASAGLGAGVLCVVAGMVLAVRRRRALVSDSHR